VRNPRTGGVSAHCLIVDDEVQVRESLAPVIEARGPYGITFLHFNGLSLLPISI
jgi:hypothetical protein